MASQPGIRLGRDDHGDPVSLPVGGVVAGRSVVAGAPDSGRRETTRRLLETLLGGGHRCLLVDTNGEFAPVRDDRVVTVAPQPESDHRVAPDDASRLVNLALRDAVPVVVDLRRDHDPAVARELLTRTLRRLRDRTRATEASLLLAVSGIDRYLPANERLEDHGRVLATIASDGPAHGLGVLGTTRRPADLKRDVLTDADWTAWHRLDRSADLQATRRLLGREHGRAIADLEDDQAVLQRRWVDEPGRRVTVSGGPDDTASTPPGLAAYHRPDPEAVRGSPLEFAAGSTDGSDDADRLARVRADLDAILDRLDRVAVDGAPPPEAEASVVGDPSVYDADGNADRASSTPTATEPGDGTSPDDSDTAETELAFGELAGIGDGDSAGSSEEQAEGPAVSTGASGSGTPFEDPPSGTTRAGTGRGVNDSVVDRKMARLRRKGEQLGAGEDATGEVDPGRADLVRLLQEPPVVDSIDGAAAESVCTRDQAWSIVGAVLAHGPAKIAALAPSVSASTDEIASVLDALESRSLVRRTAAGRYSLQEATLRTLAADAPTGRAASSPDR